MLALQADHLHLSAHFSMCDLSVLPFCPLKIGVKITSATVPALKDYMDNNKPKVQAWFLTMGNAPSC